MRNPLGRPERFPYIDMRVIYAYHTTRRYHVL